MLLTFLKVHYFLDFHFKGVSFLSLSVVFSSIKAITISFRCDLEP